MHVVWDRETMIAVGGGEYVQRPMPEDLKEILPSQPTTVQASFNGTSFKLYTNGRLVLEGDESAVPLTPGPSVEVAWEPASPLTVS